jgi:hypothetical protein
MGQTKRYEWVERSEGGQTNAYYAHSGWPSTITSRAVVFTLFWFAAHCKIYKFCGALRVQN